MTSSVSVRTEEGFLINPNLLRVVPDRDKLLFLALECQPKRTRQLNGCGRSYGGRDLLL